MGIAATSAQPDATRTAFDVLSRGGNAVDAAVAGAFMQSVVDPMQAGPGGFGAALVHRDGADVPSAYTFPARLPGGGLPDAWSAQLTGASPDGLSVKIAGDANAVGWTAIAAPGWGPGIWTLHADHGSWDWSDLLAPAIALAENGFAVLPAFARLLADARQPYGSRFRWGPKAAAIWGVAPEAGAAIRNPAYASFLRGLARDPEKAMRDVISEMPRALLAAADSGLSPDRPVPLRHDDIFATPDPTAGGVVLETLAGGSDRIAGFRAAWRRAARFAPGTTHIATRDSDGMSVGLSSSLAVPAGPMTHGFFWNGCNSGFDPGDAPGTPRFSALAPVMVIKQGRAVLSLGAQGGPHIPSALVQVLDHWQCGATLEGAIRAPRWGQMGEAIGVAEGFAAAISMHGYDLRRVPDRHAFGAVHGICLRDGLTAVADPARDGIAMSRP